MKAILFLFSTIFSTNAQDLTCPNGTMQFDPPQAAPFAITYPESFTGDLPPVFPHKFMCNYKINVPQGWFAKVSLTFNATNALKCFAPVVVTDHLGKSEEVTSAYHEPFFFLANGGNFQLFTGLTNTIFGLSVNWEQNPTTFNPYPIKVKMTDTEPQTIKSYYTSPFLISADTRVSVVMIPPSLEMNIFRLRGIMIFDGPDWNSTCLGTGYQLWKSNTQWVSTRNKLTVQLLSGSFTTDDVRLIFQDYENTKDIVQYKGVSCSAGKKCQVTLDSSNGQSAMITYIENDGTETVTGLDGNGTLDVYTGGVSNNNNWIETYFVGTGYTNYALPQTFRGNTRTYVLRTNISLATINFIRDNNYIVSDSNSIWRRGFISSSHYRESYTDQYAGAEINAPKGTLVPFTFTINSVDITQNTTLNVMIMNSGKIAYSKLYNASYLPNGYGEVSVTGDKLIVVFDSNKDSSKGLYMNFQLWQASSNFNSYVLIFAISLIAYLS